MPSATNAWLPRTTTSWASPGVAASGDYLYAAGNQYGLVILDVWIGHINHGDSKGFLHYR